MYVLTLTQCTHEVIESVYPVCEWLIGIRTFLPLYIPPTYPPTVPFYFGQFPSPLLHGVGHFPLPHTV